MVQRNLELERIALQDFVKKMGRLPQTSADWAEIHRTVYGYNLPEELKRVSEEAQRASGLTPSRDKMIESFSVSSLLGEQQKRLAEARTEVEKARKAYEAYQLPTAALATFQQALAALASPREAPLGESLLFQEAGVSGYGALSASLRARLDELRANQASYERILETMTGMYQETAKNVLDSYKTALKLYNEEADKLHNLEKIILEHQQALELTRLKHDLDLEFENYKNKLKTIRSELIPNLDALLKNYPLEFKSYLKSIAPSISFPLNEKTIADLYQQYLDLKSKGILPFGIQPPPQKTQKTKVEEVNWGQINPQTKKTPEQVFLEMGIPQDLIEMAKTVGLTPKDLLK
jgi:hypothetical protein